MFNSTIASLGLIDSPPDENVFGDYPYQIRKALAGELANFLSHDTVSGSLFPTPTHLRTVMESVGYGFMLHLEDERIIANSIEVYRKWALVPGKQPACWMQDEQYFLQRVFLHSSSLFNQRGSGNSSTDAQRHVDLCDRVLHLWLQVGRTHEKRMTVETWAVVLKTLIGVAETLYKAAEPTEVAIKLSSSFSKVLFELLLRSRLLDPTLWEILRQHFSGWTHVLSIVAQWSMSLVALTRRLTHLLWADGTEQVLLRSDDTVSLEFDDDLLLYIYHRVLTLLGNPNDITLPQSFSNAWNGLEAAVREFLRVGSKMKRAQQPLLMDGNALLHLIGSWTFQAARADRQGFDEGTSMALKTVCSVFSTLKETHFLPVYLAQLYEALQTVLLYRDGAPLVAAVTHSHFLFFSEFPGAHLLVPAFLVAVRKLLAKKPAELAQFQTPEIIRNCCIRVLGYFLALPSHYGPAELTRIANFMNTNNNNSSNNSSNNTNNANSSGTIAGNNTGNTSNGANSTVSVPTAPNSSVSAPGSQPEMSAVTFADLLPFVSNALLDAIATETAPANQLLLLSLVLCYLYTHGAEDPRFVNAATGWLLTGMSGSKQFPREVLLPAVQMLTAVGSNPQLYRILPRADEKGRALVSALSKQCLSMLVLDEPDKQELLVAILQCITAWVVADQWVLSTEHNDTVTLLLEAIVQVQRSREASRRVDELLEQAEFAQFAILHHTANFPSATAGGVERVSSVVREETELQQLARALNLRREQADQYMRAFFTADGRTLYTVVDLPPAVLLAQPNSGNGSDPMVLFTVRHKHGKFAWLLRAVWVDPDTPLSAVFLPRKPPLSVTAPATVLSALPPPVVSPVADEDMPELLRYLRAGNSSSSSSSNSSNPTAAFIVQNLDRVLARETQLLGAKQFGVAVDTTLPPPKVPDLYCGACKVPESRLLLASLGLFSEHSHKKIHPVMHAPSTLLSALAAFDALPEREAVKLGVVFLDARQALVVGGAAQSPVAVTEEFWQWALRLGWTVETLSHRGYLGGLDVSTANRAVYWADHRSELIFVLSPLLTQLRPLADVLVCAVWCSDAESFDPGTLFGNKQFVLLQLQLAILPMSCGLYQLRWFRRPDSGPPVTRAGPVVEGMVASNRSLGPLCREALLAAHRQLAPLQADYRSQAARRAHALDDVFRRFTQADLSLSQFLASMFLPLPTDLPPPPSSTGAASWSVPVPMGSSPSESASNAMAMRGGQKAQTDEAQQSASGGLNRSAAGGWQTAGASGERRSISLRSVGLPPPLQPPSSPPRTPTAPLSPPSTLPSKAAPLDNTSVASASVARIPDSRRFSMRLGSAATAFITTPPAVPTPGTPPLMSPLRKHSPSSSQPHDG